MKTDDWNEVCLDCGEPLEIILTGKGVDKTKEMQNMTEQKYSDVSGPARESSYEGEQVEVASLIGKEMLIKAAKAVEEGEDKFADFQVESGGKELTFITGSGVLFNEAKKWQDNKILEAGPIRAKLVSPTSKRSGRQYYAFEDA